MAAVAAEVPPFRCRLAEPRRFVTDVGVGVGYAVDDLDGGHARARSVIGSTDFTPGEVEPHVTIVHPRTSAQGEAAWAEIHDHDLPLEFVVTAIAITAWTGEEWATTGVVQLGG